MKYVIRIAGPAKQDLQSVSRYISTELKSSGAAKRLMLDTREAMRSLNDMPQRHPLVGDEYLASRGIRFFPVRNYLVFYAVREETGTVVIERFLYGKRDWINILKSGVTAQQ